MNSRKPNLFASPYRAEAINTIDTIEFLPMADYKVITIHYYKRIKRKKNFG